MRKIVKTILGCLCVASVILAEDGGGEMSNYIPPKREDFDTEEDYLEWLEAYEAAMYLSEEMERERHYNKK